MFIIGLVWGLSVVFNDFAALHHQCDTLYNTTWTCLSLACDRSSVFINYWNIPCLPPINLNFIIYMKCFWKWISSFMNYHWVCNKSNTTGATSGPGTAYSSGAPKFTPGFWWGCCCSFFRFLCVIFGRSLLALSSLLFLLSIVVSVPFPFKDSDYPFAIFKLFINDGSLTT